MAENTEKIDRVSLWIIGIIGFMAIFGGILQIRSHLYVHERTVIASFYSNLENIQGNDEFLSNSSAAQQLLASADEDSDGDGINNAEEETVYGTSPYLKDSDSDGVTDDEEINNNTNPTCPEGEECGQAQTGGDGSVSTQAQAAFSQLNPDAAALFKENGEVDVEALRKLMIEQGVPEEEVNKLTDDELVKLVQETMKNQEDASTNPTAQGGDTGTVEGAQQYADSLRGLTTDEKRKFLLDSGLSQEQIDQFTDEQVEALINQTVEETLKDQGIAKEDNDNKDDVNTDSSNTQQ